MRTMANKKSLARRTLRLWPLAALLLLLILSLALSGAQGLAAGTTLNPVPDNPRAIGGQPRTVTYAYDAAGRLVRADYGGAASIAYTYDAVGNLVQRQVTGASYPAYLPVIMR